MAKRPARPSIRACVILAWIGLALAGCVYAPPPSLPDPLQAGWKGQPVCEQLHSDERQRVLRCKFVPGSGHERHFHAAHFGYTIAGGTMQITDASGTRVAEVPDNWHFNSDGIGWHEVRNIGATTAIFLIVEPK